MKSNPNFLFICGKNISRSATAATIFTNDPRFNVQSAWLSPKSPHKLSYKDINRADTVFVMEQSHKKQIAQKYHDESKHIIVMDIEDIYMYMDEELTQLLHDWVDEHMHKNTKQQ